MPDQEEKEEKDALEDIEHFEKGAKANENSVLTCPECGGVLWVLSESGQIRFRCHVGHIYTSESMVEEQAEALEAALWTAVRYLKERVFLYHRMAAVARQHGSAGDGSVDQLA